MLIIDGHNLIGRTAGLDFHDEEGAREQVLRLVSAARGSGGRRVVVVFDGNRPGAAKVQSFGGIRVVYAPAGSSADDEIVKRVAAGNPRAATVVTSDRGLARRVADLGARVQSVEEFQVHRPRPASAICPPEKPAVVETEIEEWLALFTASGQRTRGGHKI